MEQNRERSWAWLLLPTMLAIIGGIIGYLLLRDTDQRRANDCLYLGIATTIMAAVAAVLQAALFASYLGGPGINV